MRRRMIGMAALVGAAALTYRFAIRPWYRSWGVIPAESGRALPGDEVIPSANGGETRAITIDAAPSDIWPWLMQMGYGRAGWYSYDAIDMAIPGADHILVAHQTLEVGDLVPTHPAGGFVVKRIDPGQALVLYLDSDLVRQQAEAARARGSEESPINLQGTGAVMGNAQPTEFSASWAFVLEPLPEERTRLIERFRVRFGEADKPWTRFTLPVMGFGVFVMMRRQLLGIKALVEHAPKPEQAAEPEPIPA